MTPPREHTTRAYGVEPGYPPYSLRMSRYQALGAAVWEHIRGFAPEQPPRIVDLGGDDARALKFIDAARCGWPLHGASEGAGGADVDYHLVDLFPKGTACVYRPDDVTTHQIDLEAGVPELPAAHFDVVICEQVLEHLRDPMPLLRDMGRIARPGALVVLGVPTFPLGVAWLRAKLQPRWDRWRHRGGGARGHIQSFSTRSLLAALRRDGCWEVAAVNGFRVISGGPLRPLEYQRWWWRANQWWGRVAPGLCVEVQVLARRRGG